MNGDGPRWLADLLPALERVLHRVRRRDHDHAATGELVLDARGVTCGASGHPGAERPGEAAVEEQRDPFGPAAVHQAVHPAGIDPGRHQPVELRVRRGEEQLAIVVLEAVARDADEQEVVPGPVGEERLERLADQRRPSVEQRLDLEPADVLATRATPFSAAASFAGPWSVARRGVSVRARRDDQRAPTAAMAVRSSRRGLRVTGHPRADHLVLVGFGHAGAAQGCRRRSSTSPSAAAICAAQACTTAIDLRRGPDRPCRTRRSAGR